MLRFARFFGVLPAAASAAVLIVMAGSINPIPLPAQPAVGLIPEALGSKLFENGTGFAWGMKGGSFVMARTKDDGGSWGMLNLAPVSIDSSSLADSLDGRSASVRVHFADPDHGWLVWSTKESVLHIASTTNGGDSWRNALSLSTDALVEDEIFPGPGRACILSEMPEGMMHTTMVTAATDDNGATWTPAFFSQGDGVSGWTFRTPKDGFLSVTYPPGVSILFYRTADGGKSWQRVHLPLPPSMSPEDVAGTFPKAPVFSGPQDLTGRLEVGLYVGNGMATATYRTSDGGKTWSFSNLVLPAPPPPAKKPPTAAPAGGPRT